MRLVLQSIGNHRVACRCQRAQSISEPKTIKMQRGVEMLARRAPINLRDYTPSVVESKFSW
jgi:hypothetical protein